LGWGLSAAGCASAGCPGEAQRAATIGQRIEAEWPLRPPGPVVDYVRAFGRELAVRAGVDQAAAWRLEVVRDRSVNAFSIGDGRIFITEGAILAAADESELAGVIAHEMGHQLAGHFCRDLGRGATGGHAPPSSAPGIGSLRQGLDPAREREAEAYAARILVDAGFDPRVRAALPGRPGDRESASVESRRDRTPTSGPSPRYPAQGAALVPGKDTRLDRVKQLLRKDL
jgi:hypothetical protein